MSQSKPATWRIWLLKRDQSPMLYFDGLSDAEALRYSQFATSKVLDGSDADAFLLTRSDDYQGKYNPIAKLIPEPKDFWEPE